MAFYYGLPQQQQQQQQTHHSSHNGSHGNGHHHGRSRRGPRLASQNSNRQFRGVRSMKELADAPVFSAFRARFESCKGFELDDDLEFCPGLLTEDDVSLSDAGRGASSPNPLQLHTAGSASVAASDRSSMSSGSPSSSPLQQQAHPAAQHLSPPFSLAPSFQPAPFPAAAPPPQSAPLKIHQPSAVRSHKAIPIVNPSTGMRVASPPSSVSPGRMQQQSYGRRW